MRENNFMKKVAQAHPAEIYILTAVTHHIQDFIKGLSPAMTWKNVRVSIRQPPQRQSQSIYHPQKQISMTNKNRQ